MENQPSNSEQAFLRFTAICAFVAVFTTLLNTQLTRFYPAPTSFEESAALINNGYYMARQWVLLIHPFPTLLLGIGLFLVFKKHHYGLALTGLLFTFLEKALEFVGQTIQLFTINKVWKPAYLATTDAAEKLQLTNAIKNAAAIWNDCFFVLWASYLIAALAFSVALFRSGGRKWTGVFLVLSAMLTLIMIVGDYGKQEWLQPALILYAPVLVVSRFLLGIMLWKAVARTTNT